MCGGYWLSSHDSARAAARYHDDQESADDWSVVELVNHRTGERLQAVEARTVTRWRTSA